MSQVSAEPKAMGRKKAAPGAGRGLGPRAYARGYVIPDQTVTGIFVASNW